MINMPLLETKEIGVCLALTGLIVMPSSHKCIVNG